MPCNTTLTQSYEANRDLLIGMSYKRGNTGVVERAYTYDDLGRALTRRTTRKGTTMNDTFSYSSRSELTEATVSGATYSYAYDKAPDGCKGDWTNLAAGLPRRGEGAMGCARINIGNRRMGMEAGNYAIYGTNALNQYTDITGAEREQEYTFTPTFDADGNQTQVKPPPASGTSPATPKTARLLSQTMKATRW